MSQDEIIKFMIFLICVAPLFFISLGGHTGEQVKFGEEDKKTKNKAT